MKIVLDLTKNISYKTFEENLEYITSNVISGTLTIYSTDQLLILNSLFLISQAQEHLIPENIKQYYFSNLKMANLYFQGKKVFKSENQFIINELIIDVNKYNDFSINAWNTNQRFMGEDIIVDLGDVNEN